MRPVFIGLVALTLAGQAATAGQAAGRSFEECQARAIALGISTSRTTRVFRKYLRYKAAGTAVRPQGLIARCMAGMR